MSEEDRAKALFFAGLDCADAGDYADAEARFREALALVPERASILANLAAVVLRQRRPDEAETLAERALALSPDNAAALTIAATAARALGHLDKALAAFDRLTAISADDAEMWAERGDVLAALSRWEAALASYDRALGLDPDHPSVLANHGNVLRQIGRPQDALESYNRALALDPDVVEPRANRGLVLQDLNRPEEALADYDRALSLQPEHPDILANRGIALYRLQRHAEALVSLARALAIRPDYPEALNGRGVVLQELGRPADALPDFDRALELRPDYAEAHHNRGLALQKLGRWEAALASFERALLLSPDHPHAFSSAADCALHLNDWERLPRFAAALEEHVRERTSIVDPFVFLGYCGDPALQLRCAETYVADTIPIAPPAIWSGGTWRNDKIRLAYLSPDFGNHPMSFLAAGLFEHHDRSRFETIALSLGPDDGSDMRRARLPAAFERFIDVQGKTDAEIATLIRDMEIDICVDLAGYTRNNRAGVFAARPAPVQVNYLGFPATMGAAHYDYIIGDRIVMPEESWSHYAENPVLLPDCFQANDDRRPLPAPPSRSEAGLPDSGFVFCCFNTAYKLRPHVFDIWMRLLQSVPGSVLWLVERDAAASGRLREAAGESGVDPRRLIFARPVAYPRHLARFRLADLFLDTTPYNGGATTSDALWCGVPVVTFAGDAFTSRMSASLLNAVGLPDMVTTSLEDYHALALTLARDPARLAEIRAKLAENRGTMPLFDSRRFTRHLEAAYTTMWERWQSGAPPAPFAVSAIATGP